MKTENLVRQVSPLTADQWQALERMADAARDSMQTFQHALLMAAASSGDAEIDKVFCSVAESMRVPTMGGYFWHPQPEWTGGDSQNDSNHVLREPHIMGMRRLTVKQ